MVEGSRADPPRRNAATVARVPTIPQRELRNNISDVLRRAERGQRFTITVGGRPVAELRPLGRRPVAAAPARFREIIAETPTDPEWARDLSRMRSEDQAAADEPWAGSA